MKGIFLILGIISSILFVPAHAQVTSEFGFQMHPGKLLENTDGTLQVFVTSNNMMVPKNIDNLKVISSDNSIIEIIGIEEVEDKFVKNVLIKAKKSGTTSIALASSGFSSKEIFVEVFDNNNHPSQILMKVTPEEFPIDGPKHGYIALELATTGGLPTLASENKTIHLDTPNKDVIKIKKSEVVIPVGEYYAITEFEIIGSGDAIIFAETEGMEKISNIVKISKASTPLTLQLHVFPENFNSFSITKGLAIVQLLDDNGEPILAEEDIHFKLDVENPDSSINTSHDYEELQFEKEQLVIKKGSYSTFTQFTPRPDLGDSTADLTQTYNIFVSVENYLAGSDTITISHDEIGSLEGKGPSVTQVMPFLTTGEEEIIAVTYYETEIEVMRQTGGSTGTTTNRASTITTVPVQSNEDHKIIFTSSELDTVNPIDPIMNEGENIVIVFGETGNVVAEDPVIFSITDNEGIKTIEGLPIGPVKEDISLNVISLVPKILAEKEFPIIAYLDDSGGEEETNESGEEEETDPRLGVTSFIEDGILTFSANEFVETDSKIIKQNQDYVISNMMSNKVGQTEISYQMEGLDGEIFIKSYTTDPTEIYLSLPENILTNSETLATLQLLDSIGNPVYAKKDIEINLVSNDEQILKIPENMIISEGSYFTTFKVETSNEGNIELALLSENFALSKYDINIVDISPILELVVPSTMNWNERIEAKLSITIPEITTALDGFKVDWITDGGQVRSMDTVTNNQGIAIMNIIPNEKNNVSITVNVLGNGLSESSISKTVEILNIPTDEIPIEETPETQVSETSIDYIIILPTIIPIIIPIIIVGVLFYLKRTDRLDLVREKIPIMEKIEEIKERISDIRDR